MPAGAGERKDKIKGISRSRRRRGCEECGKAERDWNCWIFSEVRVQFSVFFRLEKLFADFRFFTWQKTSVFSRFPVWMVWGEMRGLSCGYRQAGVERRESIVLLCGEKFFTGCLKLCGKLRARKFEIWILFRAAGDFGVWTSVGKRCINGDGGVGFP